MGKPRRSSSILNLPSSSNSKLSIPDSTNSSDACTNLVRKRKRQETAKASGVQTRSEIANDFTEPEQCRKRIWGKQRVVLSTSSLTADKTQLDKVASSTAWTCPLCKIEFQGKASTVYSKRRHHIHTRHKDAEYKLFLQRPLIQVCIASEHIAPAERGWSCPFCEVGLPSLPKRAANLAVSHHHRTAHPEVDKNPWKSAMVSLWSSGVKKPRVGSMQRTKAESFRKETWSTHDLIEVKASTEKAKAYRNTSQWYCLGCAAKVGGYGGNNVVKNQKLTCDQVKQLPQTVY